MGRASGAHLSLAVLDASIVGSWYIPSQATTAASALYGLRPKPDWRAPYCFGLEVLNLLLRAERLRRLRERAVEEIEADLRRSIRVVLEPAPSRQTTGLAISLSRVHELSLFDAFYLHLAMELGAPLATRDKALSSAARREGCRVLDAGAAA